MNEQPKCGCGGTFSIERSYYDKRLGQYNTYWECSQCDNQVSIQMIKEMVILNQKQIDLDKREKDIDLSHTNLEYLIGKLIENENTTKSNLVILDLNKTQILDEIKQIKNECNLLQSKFLNNDNSFDKEIDELENYLSKLKIKNDELKSIEEKIDKLKEKINEISATKSKIKYLILTDDFNSKREYSANTKANEKANANVNTNEKMCIEFVKEPKKGIQNECDNCFCLIHLYELSNQKRECPVCRHNLETQIDSLNLN